MPVLRTKTSRMWLPDALRGLALLNMLAYHAMYDWVYVFGHESSWYNIWAPGCHVWQQYICWSFILLSGFSFPLAKRPAKNGLIVAGCAAVAPRQGRAARRAASSVCHRAQYAAGLHAASARNLRCTVGVAHGAGVKGPKYEQYKNFHFSENCC